MKVIIIPEAAFDKRFEDVLERSKVWREIAGHKSDMLLEHFKLELNRLKEDLKNG